jgi:hypothetical protein
VLAEFIAAHPTAPLACRLDARTGRWRPVPVAERERHLDRIVLQAAAPDPAEPEPHIADQLRRAQPDLPFLVVVSPSSVLTLTDHAVGDAATLTRQLLALASTDRVGLDALAQRVTLRVPARALARGARAHLGDWAGYVRARSGPPESHPTGPAGPPSPACPSTTPRCAA